MTTFDEREHAYEAKFMHDEELRFKATARSIKLLGAWAAGHMGLGGEEADHYIKGLIHEGIEKHGAADVVSKVVGDLAAKGVNLPEGEVQKKMIELMAQSVEWIEAGN